ncbi:MAG: glycogen synthase GlgA [Bradyrhizobium sp.]|nr:glycogen synthase GlgA [Bradyrhizobium sp.]
MTPVRVLSVASEIYPIIKTGGLADVAGALPIALAADDVEVRTLVPGYPDVMEALSGAGAIFEWPLFFGGASRLVQGSCGELKLFVLDAPHLFARPGNPYLSPEGVDWPDNGLRFAGLARMADNIGLGAVTSFLPDIVHAHDWQAALAPAYLHYSGRPRPGTVITVHNLAFQGRFPRSMLEAIGLPPDSLAVQGVEYYGDIGYLKAGLQFADRVTTVSPTYAREIQSDEGGMGLGGLLRTRSGDISGILNGIDTSVWNPATDPQIASRYDAGGLDRRAANKAALQQRFGLEPRADAFLLGVISRLSWQKGLDLLLEAFPALLGEDIQLAVLGSGDADLQERYRGAAQAHAGKVGAVIGYDEALAHLIQAGSDGLVVPSRFEPCGLTQLCALRYGAVPIVSRVGGLEDTVADADGAGGVATGFKFAPVTTDRLAGAVLRAHAAFADKPAWRTIQRNGMSTDVSWRNRASRYADLYREIVKTRAAPPSADTG